MESLRRLGLLGALCFLVCHATTVARLSLEDMVGRSEAIVIGHVTRTWSAWDDQHRYIWTHAEIAVHEAAKGARGMNLVVSEPGGAVGGVGMRVAGAPTYTPGEQVMLFLERAPNGYLRSAGLGQGKLRISADGRIHLTHAAADLAVSGRPQKGIALESLEGAAAVEIRQRVERLLQPGVLQPGTGKLQ